MSHNNRGNNTSMNAEETNEGNSRSCSSDQSQMALFWQQHFWDESNQSQSNQEEAQHVRLGNARRQIRRNSLQQAQRLTQSATQQSALDDVCKQQQAPHGATVRRRRRAPRRSSTGTFLGSRMPLRDNNFSHDEIVCEPPPPMTTLSPRSSSQSLSRLPHRHSFSFASAMAQAAQEAAGEAPPTSTSAMLDAKVAVGVPVASSNGNRSRRGGSRNGRISRQNRASRPSPNANRQQQRSPTRPLGIGLRRAHTTEPNKTAETSPRPSSGRSVARRRTSFTAVPMHTARRPQAGIDRTRSRSATRNSPAGSLRRNQTSSPRAHSRTRQRQGRLNSSPVRTQQQQQQIQLDQQLQHMVHDCDKLAYLEDAGACDCGHDPDQTPGAFSVAGLDASLGDSTGRISDVSGMNDYSYQEAQAAAARPGRTALASQGISQAPLAEPGQTRRPSSPVLAVATAVLVNESEDANDFESERNVLVQKQLELAEREERLAQQMAKLQAWEEQLEQRRREMEAQGPPPPPTTNATIVQASPVVTTNERSNHTSIQSSGGHPVPPPHTSRRPRLMRGFLSSRSISNDSHMDSGVCSLDSAGLATTGSMDADMTAEVCIVGVGGGGPLQQSQTSNRSGAVSLDMALARAELGDGPLRFAPPTQYSLREVLGRLSPADQKAFYSLKQRWENRQDKRMVKYGSPKHKHKLFELPVQWHLQYLHLCAKQHKKNKSFYFSAEKAWSSERKVQKRFVNLNVFQMHEQLQSKTLFPVPGLKTSGGHNMFYMRPSRYFPNRTSVKSVIDNLCYVMNTMLENNEFAQKEGIGFVACMDDWAMKNFDVNYCFQFMMGLQGFMIPVKTQLFLIVNPPSWFGGIWKIMKPMLAPSFRKRVKIVPEEKISKYLAPGYQQYLPDDMQSGLADTDAMVQDFIAFRRSVERDVVLYGEDSGGAGSDVMSIAPSEASPLMHNMDYDEMRQLGRGWSLSSDNSVSLNSAHSGSGNASGTSLAGFSDDDDASIHCDIEDDDMLENEDMKQAATPEHQ